MAAQHFQGSILRAIYIFKEAKLQDYDGFIVKAIHFEGHTLRETKKCYRILTNVLQNRFKQNKRQFQCMSKNMSDTEKNFQTSRKIVRQIVQK